ncbi:carbamoyltransferase N-terminal domain-containing protein [Helicobacter canis]|uniref:carbamoyltransferase N-terminal domain-containing protein n=1 Tax=Helicobacter canis TaxID=29419 RepID=UPI00215DBDD8|nr:carbamoyltransferase N-terminal domain-containing protein [Helicobacter canis]
MRNRRESAEIADLSRKAESITLDSIDSFVFYDKPFLTFERLLETYFATAPKGFLSFVKAIPVWLSTKLFLKETIARELESLYKKLYPQKSKQEIKAFKQKVLDNLYFSEHHLSHCSSAFFPSPFRDAGILTLDGIGEWATTTIARGLDNHIEILQELHFPHSLGLLYSAFTYYLGFKVNSGEYKVMGLAPYGEPKFVETIKTHLIDMKPDGSFSLNMKYFSYTYGLKMTNAKFDSLFHAQRSPESKLEQVHMDIAASLQVVTEEIMIALARTTARLSGSRNLVLSGGVALNCVGNGKIYQKLIKEEKLLDHIWVQPASGDAGSAVGCGLAYYHIECKQPRYRDSAFGLESRISSPRCVDRHPSLISLRGSKSHDSSSKILESRSGFTKQAETKTTALESTFESPTAKQATAVQGEAEAGFFRIPRILEEEKGAECEKSASSSSRADEVGVAIHKGTKVDSSAKMDCHAAATAASRNDRKNAASENAVSLEKVDSRENAKNVSKQPKDSRILELESGLSNAANIKGRRRQDLGDRIVALQGDSRAHTRAYVTAESPQQSAILAPKPTPKISPSNSKICDEKCGLQGKSQGSYLKGNDCSDFLQLPHLSHKAELPLQDSMQGSYLGLSYSNDEVQAALDSLNAIYEKHSFDTIKTLTAKALSEGKVVGWHQGRCEFGPRALGARSILGDPRNTTMQKTMNLKIKYRESFRPFAPSVLDFAINEWFECDYISPYMLLVAPVKREKCYPLTKEQKELFGIEKLNIIRSEIPSVTHIDYSARIQSVHKETNPRYYALIEEFYKLSGVPVLVNTSFNVRGEPMVCSPYDSYACFMGTEMDLLVIEDFILYKEKQPQEHIAKFRDIKDKYELD